MHEGSFYIRKTLRALVDKPDRVTRWVKVWNPEEKGSDVNLATYLVRDGFQGAYDVAVVISDDSDLLEPVRLVRRELARPVGVVNVRERRSVFRKDADFFIRPVKWQFEESQLPTTVPLPQGGQVECPARWLAARTAADSGNPSAR